MNFDLTTISNEMPDFENHDQARQWFNEQFQERFSLVNSDIVNGKKVYYYHIIKDQSTYQQYMESFAKAGEHQITNFETFESYSTVEINEEGDISLSL
ncbi:hypothetical protein NC661_06365 [Aquibacillus koreensis]|uniref:Uncharacterized protein n=1 Tax=Aquibacillus koreensis TaxID=279446 RepID=A0A9X4AHD0_9BACI|nr:hypothetical protein [Aquibacillus koreensis]MCT2535723.1 hypothetical protein [Aquibacillus koreensis]MDC3419992.1 hypothetical protein [Aquibacillus koreensis]